MKGKLTMVTPLYAGILGIIYIVLTFFTISGRIKHKISLGAGGNSDMETKIRIDGNFIEYVPLALILMAFAEFEGIHEIVIHIAGAALVIGRIIHAGNLSGYLPLSYGRQIGMVMTLLTIIAMSVLCIAGFFKF